MSSEEKISPEEFDKELESLLTGTPEKKPKNPKRKKIIIAATAIAIIGIVEDCQGLAFCDFVAFFYGNFEDLSVEV